MKHALLSIFLGPLFLLALLLLSGLLTQSASASISKRPGVLILCETGGVYRSDSHVASGGNCVLHDSSGTTLSVATLTVYDDSGAMP